MNNENDKMKSGNRPGILFVDDEQNILKSLFRLFRDSGYDLYFAESGHGALEILEKRHIDVLVTDHRMPGMTGTDLLKIVKTRWPHIVRLVLSGYTDVNTLLTAINEGEVFRFITKPWNDEALLSLVAKSIEEAEILKGFMRLVDILRETVPDHNVEAIAEIEKGTLCARLVDDGKKVDREKMAMLIPILLDNIHEQFSGIDSSMLSGLVAKRMGRVNFTADVGAGVQLSIDIPIDD